MQMRQQARLECQEQCRHASWQHVFTQPRGPKQIGQSVSSQGLTWSSKSEVVQALLPQVGSPCVALTPGGGNRPL